MFNNICFQTEGVPGMAFAVAPEDDFQADGNLEWSLHGGPPAKLDILAQFRKSAVFEKSKAHYPPGWAANDVLADPKFAGFSENYAQPSDFRLQPDSPAMNAGVSLPESWPDPLRGSDNGRPDIGAIPAGVEPWRIGVNGRYSICGPQAAAR